MGQVLKHEILDLTQSCLSLTIASFTWIYASLQFDLTAATIILIIESHKTPSLLLGKINCFLVDVLKIIIFPYRRLYVRIFTRKYEKV
jgi:hypothetical protein